MTAFSRRRFLQFTAAGSFIAAFPVLAFAEGGADAYVQQLGAEVLRLANAGHRGDKALQHRFAALFNRYINIPTVANFALGQAQRDLPPGDKAMFYDLVSNYAAALFVWYVDDFKGQALTVLNSAQQGKFTTVDTAIDGRGEKLRWRVAGGSGAFRIADLNVKGVWLSISMKKLFEDTLNNSNGNFQALYGKLREAETW